MEEAVEAVNEPARPPIDINVDQAQDAIDEPVKEGADDEEKQSDSQPQADEKPKDEPFPKKAINALSRRDKKIGKLQAEKAALERQLAETGGRNAPDLGKEPQEDDFETYGKYLAAVSRWNAKQEFHAEREGETKHQAERAQNNLKNIDAELLEARREVIDQSAMQAMAAFSDFEQVIEGASIGQQGQRQLPLSDAAKEAFFEAGDDSAFALYSVLKDDALDELNSLSLAKAAMMVARHVEKGRSISKAKKVSSAPEPMAPAKGTATASKDPNQMSQSEYSKWRQERLKSKGLR